MAEGRVIKGRFGGVGAIDASNAPEDSAAPGSASGNPVTPGDVQQQLGLLAHNAQVAATRLIQIPPTGSVPADLLTSLLHTFVQIQGNLADVASRIGTEDAAAAAKDAGEIQAQIQAFIDGVETAIKSVVPAAAVSTSSALAPVKKEVPWMLIGAGGLGLLAIGVGIYQYQKTTARASRAAASARRKPSAFAGAPTRKRGRGRKGRRHFVEE
jgi:hypothetical protein